MSAASSAPVPDKIMDKIRSALTQLGVKVVDELPPKPKGRLRFCSYVVDEQLRVDIETGIKNTVENVKDCFVKEVIIVRRVEPGMKPVYKALGWRMETQAMEQMRKHLNQLIT